MAAILCYQTVLMIILCPDTTYMHIGTVAGPPNDHYRTAPPSRVDGPLERVNDEEHLEELEEDVVYFAEAVNPQSEQP